MTSSPSPNGPKPFARETAAGASVKDSSASVPMSLTLDRSPPRGLDTADTGQFPARNERPRGSYWAVVQTHPQAERWAETNLRRQGYPTLLPLMRVRRRDRVLRSLFHTVEVPLFPGYCFVTVTSHWTP